MSSAFEAGFFNPQTNRYLSLHRQCQFQHEVGVLTVLSKMVLYRMAVLYPFTFHPFLTRLDLRIHIIVGALP